MSLWIRFVILSTVSACVDGAANLDLQTTLPGRTTDEDRLTCRTPNPGPAPLRRLSHTEYQYALEDLFANAALAQAQAGTLVRDPTSLGFSNSATLLDVKPVLAQQYMEAAERVAEAVTADLTRLLACDTTAVGELECVRRFIQRLGARAYRRSLLPEEQDGYITRFQTLRAGYDLRTGVEWIVSTMLQSPQFLYRAEIDPVGSPTIRALQPAELAARLSAFIWHSVPDDSIVSAVAAGKLSTKGDVEREARRMLADPRGARVLSFFTEWLDVDKLGSYPRDPSLFPNLPGALPTLFSEETRSFVRNVLFEGGGKLETLFTADFTYVNEPLARHYGMTGITGTAFRRVPLPDGRRGVWMQGGPLTAHDKQTRTSIVNRGLRVRTGVLCDLVPAPPNDVVLELGPIDPNLTQADRLAAHRTNPTCASCHNLMDPIGQAFEHVNAVGRLRTHDEAGNPVQVVGAVTNTDDADGPVSSAVELMSRLGRSEQVRQCVSTQLFRYAHGRQEQDIDACSQKQAFDRFQESGFDLRELIIGIVLSDDFLYRAVPN